MESKTKNDTRDVITISKLSGKWRTSNEVTRWISLEMGFFCCCYVRVEYAKKQNHNLWWIVGCTLTPIRKCISIVYWTFVLFVFRSSMLESTFAHEKKIKTPQLVYFRQSSKNALIFTSHLSFLQLQCYLNAFRWQINVKYSWQLFMRQSCDKKNCTFSFNHVFIQFSTLLLSFYLSRSLLEVWTSWRMCMCVTHVNMMNMNIWIYNISIAFNRRYPHDTCGKMKKKTPKKMKTNAKSKSKMQRKTF